MPINNARDYKVLRNYHQGFLWRSSTTSLHAIYGEYNALVSIESLEIIEGDLPSRAQKMVIDWAGMYQQDLLKMWNDQEFRKLPPLK